MRERTSSASSGSRASRASSRAFSVRDVRPVDDLDQRLDAADDLDPLARAPRRRSPAASACRRRRARPPGVALPMVAIAWATSVRDVLVEPGEHRATPARRAGAPARARWSAAVRRRAGSEQLTGLGGVEELERLAGHRRGHTVHDAGGALGAEGGLEQPDGEVAAATGVAPAAASVSSWNSSIVRSATPGRPGAAGRSPRRSPRPRPPMNCFMTCGGALLVHVHEHDGDLLGAGQRACLTVAHTLCLSSIRLRRNSAVRSAGRARRGRRSRRACGRPRPRGRWARGRALVETAIGAPVGVEPCSSRGRAGPGVERRSSLAEVERLRAPAARRRPADQQEQR